MDTIGAQNSGIDASIRDLARSLDCIPDEDLQALANVKASTTEAWRKRGKGLPTSSSGTRSCIHARRLPSTCAHSCWSGNQARRGVCYERSPKTQTDRFLQRRARVREQTRRADSRPAAP